jgi:iron complex transport system ATP-binding protein
MRELQTERIKAGYGDRIIIEDLSLSIPIGKITTIIGPNGCGKSTFLKALGRIIQVKSGAVVLDGEDIHKMKTIDLAKKMAILPQSPAALEGVTVEELVAYGRFPYQRGVGKLKKEDERIIDWAMEATNLIDIRTQQIDSLSGGQRQRAWIAMALAQETDMILLDEPTTYLDMAYQLEVLELLEQLNKEHNCTIIMVLHDLNLASRFADYMVAFREGKIIKSGSANEVMTKEVLRRVYEIDAHIAEEPLSSRPICLSYQLVNKKERVQRGA